MRLPFVTRRKYERLERRLKAAEKNALEWKERAIQLEVYAESLQLQGNKKKKRWPAITIAAWLLIIGVLIGGSAVPHINDKPTVVQESSFSEIPATPDYSGCIGNYTYNNPIKGNQFQELVNALHACGIYGGP